MIVYRHIRLDKNEPFYIGIGSSERRAYDTRSRNPIWRRIVNKTDYRVEILFDDLSKEDACEKEKEFIALYGRSNLGTGTLCNLTAGGDGTVDLVVSEKTKEIWRKQRAGSGNGRYGKPVSEETRLKISMANKGRIVGEAEREAKRINSTGRVHSELSKEKLKLKKDNIVNSFQYFNQSPLINNETGHIFPSIRKFCDHYNMASATAKRRVKNGWVDKLYGYRKMTEQEIAMLKGL